MVARKKKKKNSMQEQTADPFQSVIQSLSRPPHQSIHQFSTSIHGQEKRIMLYSDFVHRPLNFLLGTWLA